MTYSEALEYITVRSKASKKPSLEPMKELLNLLSNPQDDLEFIHIAGTNGKGSTTTMLSNVLKNAKYKVGKFISPYVYEFSERISINGVKISQDDLCYYVSVVKSAIDANNLEKPSEFSIITAVAMLYFKDRRCDIVCLEAGLGGRFDSTNAINSPKLSIITKIALDHTKILGDTIEKITEDKCDIIKNSKAVIYPLQDEKAMDIIKKFNISVPLLDNLTIKSCDLEGSLVLYSEKEYKISLIGEHQIYNALTVIKACEELVSLGYDIKYEHIYEALAFTYFEGRMEIISKEPLVIFDGSHNLDGINALAHSIETKFKDKKVLIIMAMQRDKDVLECVEKISSLCDIALYTQLDMPSTALCSDLLLHNKAPNALAFYNAESAFKISKSFTKDVTIICGSFYLDAKKFF